MSYAPSLQPGVGVSQYAISLALDINWPYYSQWPRENALLPQYCVFNNGGEDGFAENYTAAYANIEVPGRQENYVTYSGTNNVEVGLNFHMIAQQDGDVNGSTSPNHWGRWLTLLKAPTYLANATPPIWIPPPPLILNLGSIFAGRVVMTDCGMVSMPPFDVSTYAPYYVICNCTFTVTRAPAGVGDYSKAVGIVTDPTNLFLQFPG